MELQRQRTSAVGRIPELQNVPSHYPVPVGTRPRAVPLLHHPDYDEVVNKETGSGSKTELDHILQPNTTSSGDIRALPPCYESAINM